MTRGADRHRKRSCLAGAALLGLALAGCATTPLAPYSTATPAMVLTPVAQAGIADGRGRFREIFCAVLGARSRTATAALSCDQALVRLDDEPSGTGAPVDLAASRGAFTVVYVLGLWSDCADQTLRARTEMNDYLARFGFHLEALKVSGISGTRHKRAPHPRRAGSRTRTRHHAPRGYEPLRGNTPVGRPECLPAGGDAGGGVAVHRRGSARRCFYPIDPHRRHAEAHTKTLASPDPLCRVVTVWRRSGAPLRSQPRTANMANGTVTLTGPQSRSRTIKAVNPLDLKTVQVGIWWT